MDSSDLNRLDVALAPKLNLSFYQNSVPFLRELVVINEGKEALQEVEVTLACELPFVKTKTWRIDVVGTGQNRRLKDLDVMLDGAFLGHLTEAVMAPVTFILKAAGKELARLDRTIELLPRNQWGGIGHVPEMIAAFVQPNEPAIEHLLKNAAEVLRKNGKSSALNGYEGGAKHVWEMTAAIWVAVGSMGLDYSLPPASFECTGQKIRSPAQIADTGIATCMDTTLFFCAALEQCGLNPLIVFTTGHAVAGVWLKAEEFTTAVVDDITALRKREKLKELILFETTLVTQRPCPTFKRAVESGAEHISEEKEGQFELAVDVRRARLQRIKPLASEHVITPPGPSAGSKEELEPVFDEAPELPDDEILHQGASGPSEPKDRLDLWQRKLHDLSLRNSLLNFRATRRAIKLDAPDPGRIEDLLSEGHVLKILPRPDLMEGKDPRSQAIHEARTNEDVRRAHALDALNRNELMAGLSKEELESRLVELYRFARASLQEGGANILFLAMGFLSWTKDEKDNKHYRAPLILIPVSLQRRSVRSGFSLRLHEDEPRFNPTVIEMLRQDFNLELPVTQGELERDEHGLDIMGIWRAVAHAIKDIRGWEVIEDVVLSSFSFAKYLMWKDLVDRTDQLKQNPVVKHLIDTPNQFYVTRGEFCEPCALDRKYGPEQIFCPLSADSSQLSAVIAAANGNDFVLIGPPGTGKSQTIANLIAHCLAEQKTVLFVSQKIAALNVVYRRICEIKLGDFCVELHSNKARKLDVLQQLGRAWEAKGSIDAEEWKREAQRLKAIRDQLNDFVAHLHSKRRNGLTAYGAIGHVVAGSTFPKLDLSWPSADIHSEDDRLALEDLSEKLDLNALAVGGIAESPLAFISAGAWSPSWQQSLVNAARDLISASEILERSAESFFAASEIPRTPLDEPRREGLALLSKALPSAAGRDWRFALRPDARTIAEELQNGLALLRRYRETNGQLSIPWSAELVRKVEHGIELIARHRDVASQLSAPYGSGLSGLDVRQLRKDWEKAEKSLFFLSWLKRRRVRSALSRVVESEQDLDLPADLDRMINLRELEDEVASLADLSKETSDLWTGLETQVDNMRAALKFQAVLSSAANGQDWNDNGLETVAAGLCGAGMAVDLERLRTLRSLERDMERFQQLQAKTNGLWNGLTTHTEELEGALDFQKKLPLAIAKTTTTAESLNGLKGALEHLLGDGNALLEPTGPISGTGSAYCEALERFQSALGKFSAIAGTSNVEIATKSGDTPDKIISSCGGIIQLEPKLRAWCAWRKVRNEAIVLGLAPLVIGIETGAVQSGKVKDAFKTDYARWWLNAIVDNDEVLRGFVSIEHEKRIADFKALDDRLTELTRDYVRAGLCAGLPNQQDPPRNSEWGILRKEMQKKKRHMPLRELVNSIPTALAKLAPCLLMSPLSIAQYLSADTPIFDIVVFDEASQIPVWDAIGAIARGKQVVMVGDPKQLPPTSFFDRAESETDHEDVDADLESILDECLGSNLPTLNLSWHYRSRHESLIAFSNSRYYGGALVTFPSPSTNDNAVSLHIVKNGIYEKGGARINKPEAQALVKHIVSRLRDPEFRARGLSIGVVTFNIEQQRLIEDLLDSERRKTPAIEPYFADEGIEPIFVKNLESVQGDERDIMYFSITYGPDSKGAISFNFGPMNRDGGERRLNVAITRARQELRIFSSLRPEQIDLSRTQAEGVRDLKHFMEFAERGSKAIAEAVYGTIGDYDSQFEKMVSEALASKGWQVHPQVGVSSFRIDLGIVDPDFPGRYLAGVECDGATYHRSATARDRDKLREHVLRNLGWNIVRIWSTDWWVDAPGALEKVHSHLKRLLQDNRARRKEDAPEHEEAGEAIEIEGEQEDGGADETEDLQSEKKEDGIVSEGDETAPPMPTVIPPPTEEPVPETHQRAYNHQEGSKRVMPGHFADYHDYEGPSFSNPHSTDTREVAEGLYRIIEIEGPMISKRAYDIYLRGCGVQRMGGELKRAMNRAMQLAVRKSRVIVEDELNTTGYLNAVARIAGTPPIVLRKRGSRTFEEIPPSEILVAAQLALRDTPFETGSDEHLHAMLAMFDLKRLSNQVRARLLKILELNLAYVSSWLSEHNVEI